MNWFDTIFVFLGGLGFFFYGMKQFSNALQEMGSDLIKKILSSITANRILGVLAGVVLTCLVQSSSVVTVMTVGFVNAGMMSLYQAISVVFGANIGTTITGWIIAIKIGKYGIHMVGIGAIPMLFFRNETLKKVGAILFGLGLIFFGLETMSAAFKPLRTNPEFLSYITYFTAETTLSLLGTILMGCVLTMIVQSSSAMLGITMALASTGTISFQTAAALVLGENIGTTVTAVLASIGTNTNAKRTAAAHAFFNISGVIIMALIFVPYISMIENLIPGLADLTDADGSKPYIAAHIAASHSVFNVCATLLFLPFLKVLAGFVSRMIPTPPHEEMETLKLVGDPNTLSPVMAISQAYSELAHMGEITQRLIGYTRQYILEEANGELLNKVNHFEQITDNIQKEIVLFVSALMQRPLTPHQALKVNGIISVADDLESIGDYCQSMARFRKRLAENKHSLREATRTELREFLDKIEEAYQVVLSEIKAPNSANLERFDNYIYELKDFRSRLRQNHLERIKSGDYLPLSGLTFTDMVVSLHKISGHMAGINKAILSFRKE
jgi:phosphate:Na+ symporter